MSKTKENKRKEFFAEAMNRLFQTVGFEYFDEEFINHPFWYTKKSWTPEDEHIFTTWFVDEFIRTFKKSKKYAIEECRWFLLNYGWTHVQQSSKQNDRL